MAHDFPLYAELWREQIGPEELAELQAMAKNIEHTARWRRLFDALWLIAFAAVAGLALWLYPSSPAARLALALLMAVLLGMFWIRNRLTRASRATIVDDPTIFFDKAIRNVRAEINLYTLSSWLTAPGLLLGLWVMSTLRDLSIPQLFVRELRDQSPLKTIGLTIAMMLGGFFFTRDYMRLREQLRRLESMSREWNEHQTGNGDEERAS